MKIIAKLSNPFILAANGFVLGIVLFASSANGDAERQTLPQSVSSYQIAAA